MARIVEIIWRDHAGSHGWATEKQTAKPMTITQIGYLIEETDEYYVTLDSRVTDTSGQDDARTMGCSTCILKATVQSFAVIRESGD